MRQFDFEPRGLQPWRSWWVGQILWLLAGHWLDEAVIRRICLCWWNRRRVWLYILLDELESDKLRRPEIHTSHCDLAYTRHRRVAEVSWSKNRQEDLRSYQLIVEIEDQTLVWEGFESLSDPENSLGPKKNMLRYALTRQPLKPQTKPTCFLFLRWPIFWKLTADGPRLDRYGEWIGGGRTAVVISRRQLGSAELKELFESHRGQRREMTDFQESPLPELVINSG